MRHSETDVEFAEVKPGDVILAPVQEVTKRFTTGFGITHVGSECYYLVLKRDESKQALLCVALLPGPAEKLPHRRELVPTVKLAADNHFEGNRKNEYWLLWINYAKIEYTRGAKVRYPLFTQTHKPIDRKSVV